MAQQQRQGWREIEGRCRKRGGGCCITQALTLLNGSDETGSAVGHAEHENVETLAQDNCALATIDIDGFDVSVALMCRP